MLRPFRLLNRTPKIDFIGKRYFAFAFTAFIILASAVSLATRGLNLGIDFQGGILIEVKTKGPADLAGLRATLGKLDLGEVALQDFGAADDVLIRVQRQEGGEKAQQAAVEKVKQALGDTVTQYRRTEFVGPKVGEELIQGGILAVVLSILAISVYIWFRFEWQFGVGALVSTFHDVISTFGLFSLLGLEFNLTIVAAILTIAGYSINDTVVEYDRVRENLRKYKKMPLIDLLNLSVNETLSRTMLTGGTTLVAVLALYLFGGEVIKGFAFAMIWGVLIGTFSSVYVAMPVLIYFKFRLGGGEGAGAEGEEAAAQPAP
jgi:preprotein translocase subunit SecF